MPTRNISLTAEQDAFIDPVIQAGDNQNASEVFRDALRAQLGAGIAALGQGAFTEVEDAELDTFLDGLTAPAAQ